MKFVLVAFITAFGRIVKLAKLNQNANALKPRNGDPMKNVFLLSLLALTACGAQGPTGTNGTNGSNGTDGSTITTVQFCSASTVYPSTFSEVGLCINGNLWAVYSANDGFLTEIVPGAYTSDGIGSSCNFTVLPNCIVSN